MTSIASQLDLLTKDWISSTVRVGETVTSRYGYTNAPAAPLIARAVQYVLILAALNAQMCCSVPIRLVKPARSTGKPKQKSFRERARAKWMRNSLGVGVKAARYAGYAEETEEVTEHPVLELLRQPNPFMDGGEWEELSQLCLEVGGNCYDYIDGDSSGPQEIYPLYPSFVRIIPSDTDYIEAYVYARDTTDPFVVDYDAVGHQKFRPSMTGDYYGTGPLHACLMEADLTAAATVAEQARWKNGSRPDYAIESTVPITSKDQLEQIRAEVRRYHRGVNKTGEPMILGQAKLNTLGFKPKDMEYLSGTERCDEVLRNAYGVPESMVALNDANLASSTTGNRQYMAQTIAPRRSKRAEYLTERFLPMFGVKPGEMWFCPDDASGEDEDAETTRKVTLVDCGGMTLNELRAEEGLDPYEPEIGDVPRYKGVELVSAAVKAEQDAAAMESEQAHQMALATATAKQPVKDTTAKDLATAIMDGAKGLVETTLEKSNGKETLVVDANAGVESSSRGGGEGDDVDFTKGLSKSLGSVGFYGPHHDHTAKSVDVPEERPLPVEVLALRDAFDVRLRDWFKDAINAFAEAGDGAVPAEKLAELDARLEAIATEYIGKIAGEGAMRGATDLGLSFDVPPTSAMNFMDSYLPKFKDGVTMEIRQGVKDAIARGIENGLSVPKVTALIQEQIPEVAQWKAEQIARTETAHAMSQGNLSTMYAAGVTQKRWLLSGNPCPICVAIAALGAIPIGQAFYPAGWFDGQTPPAHPQCACDFAAVTP